MDDVFAFDFGGGRERDELEVAVFLLGGGRLRPDFTDGVVNVGVATVREGPGVGIVVSSSLSLP